MLEECVGIGINTYIDKYGVSKTEELKDLSNRLRDLVVIFSTQRPNQPAPKPFNVATGMISLLYTILNFRGDSEAFLSYLKSKNIGSPSSEVLLNLYQKSMDNDFNVAIACVHQTFCGKCIDIGIAQLMFYEDAYKNKKMPEENASQGIISSNQSLTKIYDFIKQHSVVLGSSNRLPKPVM